MPALRSSSRSSAARLVLATLPAAALLAAPQGGQCQAPAQGYLERLARSRTATYQARQLVVYMGEPQSAAVVEVRATPEGTYVRAETPSAVARVWRDASHGLLSSSRMAIEDLTPPSVPLELDGVLRKYEVVVGERTAILGVPVVPLELVRRQDGRAVERLFVHPDWGVVYRRELLGPGGRLVGLATVLEMRWGEAARGEPYEGPTPVKVRPDPAPRAPKSLPYGYRLLSAYRLAHQGRAATHWLYSDGLHPLSVFRIRGGMRHPATYRAVDLGPVTGWAGPGPGTWMWEGGKWVWVVVAEEAQLDPAVLTAPFPKGGRGVWSRMGSWWARAGRWVLGLFR